MLLTEIANVCYHRDCLLNQPLNAQTAFASNANASKCFCQQSEHSAFHQECSKSRAFHQSLSLVPLDFTSIANERFWSNLTFVFIPLLPKIAQKSLLFTRDCSILLIAVAAWECIIQCFINTIGFWIAFHWLSQRMLKKSLSRRIPFGGWQIAPIRNGCKANQE